MAATMMGGTYFEDQREIAESNFDSAQQSDWVW